MFKNLNIPEWVVAEIEEMGDKKNLKFKPYAERLLTGIAQKHKDRKSAPKPIKFARLKK